MERRMTQKITVKSGLFVVDPIVYVLRGKRRSVLYIGMTQKGLARVAQHTSKPWCVGVAQT
jgi:hypothetical protein